MALKKIQVLAENLITSLGNDAASHFRTLEEKRTGLAYCEDGSISSEPFYASRVPDVLVNGSLTDQEKELPRYEQLVHASVNNALNQAGIAGKDERTLFVISTTKGNIDLLEKDKKGQLSGSPYLAKSAAAIADWYGNPNIPLVVSNACISGVLAINVGVDQIRSGRYDRVVVTGGDILSAFTVSGFQSFLALGSGPCKPYDAERDGLSLGEGAATVILSGDEASNDDKPIYVSGGVSSNDANHISGPSRTGEGLYQSIQRTLQLTDTSPEAIDYLNAHGTATNYNDEMESIAFGRAGLGKVPMNSYKGALGHTLGAAGLIESVLTIHAMRIGRVLPSVGFSKLGVSEPLNVITEAQDMNLNKCLKTASGFGGCNAAVLFEK